MPSNVEKNIQYFVWPSVVLYSAHKRRGVLKTRTGNFWSGISRQMSTTAWVSSATFVGWLSMFFNPREISDQRFSIEFKSDDKEGQSMCCTFSSSRKSMTRHAQCAEALSSWNTKFVLKYLLENGNFLVSRTCIYWYWSMFPSTSYLRRRLSVF